VETELKQSYHVSTHFFVQYWQKLLRRIDRLIYRKSIKPWDITREGWDPVLRPNAEMWQADIVNLGYVLNVIEDPAERIETLTKAWSLSRDFLAVAVLVKGGEDYDFVRPFRDGIIAKRGTFQKFSEQEEALGLIESSLEVEPVPAGLGLFIAFRDAKQRQDFLRNRRIRAIDWEELTQRIGRALPSRAQQKARALFNANRDVLEEFWTKMIELGRTPDRGEFEFWDQLKVHIGSMKKAVSLLSSVFGSEVFHGRAAATERRFTRVSCKPRHP
jgi:DNA phosphorothioation-associated putative methyltransferase